MPDLTLSANIDGFLAETSALHIANGIVDGSAISSIDTNTRLLKRSGGTTELDWENCLIGGGAFQGRIDWSSAKLQNWNGSSFGQTLDWANGYLYDYYSNISVDWFNGYMSDGGNISLDWVYRSLTGNDATFAIDWGSRTLHGTGGSSCVDWSSGTPVFSFGATLTPTAVASLVGNEGSISYVNDADTPVVGSAVVSGASDKCLVCYNGTSWIVTALL